MRLHEGVWQLLLSFLFLAHDLDEQLCDVVVVVVDVEKTIVKQIVADSLMMKRKLKLTLLLWMEPCSAWKMFLTDLTLQLRHLLRRR